MSEHNLQDTISLLSRTPATLDALLRDLPEEFTHRNEGGDTFTAFDVIGHLIHADRTDWIPRARWIIEHGESRPFEAFDRHGHIEECKGKSLSQLLHEFARVRTKNVQELRGMNLGERDLARRGMHPALGVVTMSQLLSTWAAHDLTHFHQLSRILANQYREAVGPWSEYLGVMKCQGHSS